VSDPNNTIRVAVVGIGLMGAPMARQLLAAGHEVVVFNRSLAKAAALEPAGARVIATLNELAGSVNDVVLALPAGAEVRAALDVLVEHLQPGSIVVDTSTIAPHESRENYARCASRGIEYVDAPVSGGPAAVEAGTLSVMAGGNDSALDRATVLTQAFAGRFVRCGASGAGSVAKACNQLVVATTIEVVAEALVLAQAAGVDPSLVREALLGGFASSRILELHGARMLEANYVPGGKARLQLKDIDIIRELAASVGVPLDAFGAAAARFERLVADGGGELDHSAVATVLERDAGVSVARVK
jgi:2-hydroxy-3-oxopropionate reductase